MKSYKLGLIGEKLGHSFSPAIHAKLGTPDYSLFELTAEELEIADVNGDGAVDLLDANILYGWINLGRDDE
jgi:shikimate 5-dehydrogenase